MKKPLIAIVMASVILLSIFGSAIVSVVNADVAGWYTGVSGVLDSDYYSLYPFEKNSLTIGFSKFGEMVNPYTGNGLNYSGRDPFANEGILKQYWLQGWFADIRYIHRVFGARHVWAMATFADMINYGGDWLNGCTNPYLAPHGGRKTSGSAVSDDITVLYDGPRSYIGLVKTHINDTTPDSSWSLIDVVFTIIFDKVKKEVIVLKDIKLTIDPKILDNPVNVQFSNRGEWDLGPSPDWKSYAHFYHQQFETCYGADWTLAKTILREYHYSTVTFKGDYLDLDDVTDSEPTHDVPVAYRSEYVYVNGEWLKPGIDYKINYDTGIINFEKTYPAGTHLDVYFKLHKIDQETKLPMETPHLYDVAQVIAADKAVVGFAAFWPTLSDYSVDAWDRALEPLYVGNDADAQPVPSEPDIPFVVGEWDFMLDYDTATTDWGEQFRGVTVYGITNYHDAKDAQMEGVLGNKLDTEVQYQLDEVFVPWDLYSAVEKKTRREVEWYTVTNADVEAAEAGTALDIYLGHTPVRKASVWEEYESFSEKVMWGGKLRYPIRSVYAAYDYELYVRSDGVGYIRIPATKVPVAGTVIKMLYSTDTDWFNYDTIKWTWNFQNEPLGTSPVTLVWEDLNAVRGPDPLGATWGFHLDDFQMTLANLTMEPEQTSFSWMIHSNYDDVKVFKGQTAVLRPVAYGYPPESQGNGRLTMDVFRVWYEIAAPSMDDIHVVWFHPDLSITATSVTNGTHFNATVTVKIEGESGYPYSNNWVGDELYHDAVGGRYEWGIVGRDAASVDSAGLSMVSAAFKNKQVEYGLAGADMFTPLDANGNAVNQMPWVMAKFGSGDMWKDYYKSAFADNRSALRDDWSYAGTLRGDEWPVASSNMIGVGGPLANLLAYYGNDFTNAIYGIPEYAKGSIYTGKVTGPPCWNKNTYASSNTVGYAVITTYLDINGTELFLVWGHWGRDTYYACKWFHEYGIYAFQNAPAHLTSIILKINYESTTEGYKPKSYAMIEGLGTISEWWIHPDP